MSWCQTYTGQISWPLNPEYRQVISIEDIAHSLAYQCRYNGHCNIFYSVAEHSCYVADEVYKITKDNNLALKALLHDSTEAYLGDMPRPIKELVPEFKEIEKLWNSKILNYFGLSEDMPKIIKDIDYRMLYTEAKQIMKWPPPKSWEFPNNISELSIKIVGLLPELAKEKFIKSFIRYKGYYENNNQLSFLK